MERKIKYENSISTGLLNYYGNLTLNQTNNRYYLLLDDHSSTRGIEIDKETYNNLIKFKNDKPFTL